MRLTAKLLGLLSLAILNGCGSLSNLSQIELPGRESSLSGWSSQDDEIEENNGLPPIPVRNAARNKGGSTQTAGKDGEKKQALLSLPKLPDLADVKIFTAAPAEPSRITQWEEKPVAVYTKLARQIHTCWLNAAAPKLKDHGFYAEVGAGDSNEAVINIYKKDQNGKRGLQALRIEIHGNISGSTVEAKNRRLEKSQEFAFREDLTRWAQGNQNCQI
jgi:hypothetical protein